MTTNPFEDETATFLVLRNDEGQYSLWPSFAEIPDGWTSVVVDQSREHCDNYITEHWTESGPHLALDPRQT